MGFIELTCEGEPIYISIDLYMNRIWDDFFITKFEEENKMCKYCENKEQGYASIVEKEKDNDTFMRIVFNYPGKVIEGKVYTRKDVAEEPKVTYLISRNRMGYLATEISYCPFCGEKL